MISSSIGLVLLWAAAVIREATMRSISDPETLWHFANLNFVSLGKMGIGAAQSKLGAEGGQ